MGAKIGYSVLSLQLEAVFSVPLSSGQVLDAYLKALLPGLTLDTYLLFSHEVF